MKNIVTIVSALFFIVGSVFLEMFLPDGNKEISVVLKQYEYEPASAYFGYEKTESLPFDKYNAEKQVEGAHVKNARFASIRKISLHRNYFDPLLLFSKHSITLLPSPIKAQPDSIAYTVNNLPLHVRNCIWLI